MSYTVLARRYRSSTFDEVVGQAHVAQTLKKAIESGRIAHAYLFCGTRGTGKTSMARIFAKALNCERADKPTTTPCGECSSCQGIARGEDIDVIELDAASNRGIDEVRKIIENSRLVPARSRYKVYIIDEVHAMTKDAFNALLKVLEEPAPHVKFVLATTEAEKVLPTILSRCQRYDFHNISVREIADHLKSVCKREGVEADGDALLMLARAGNGSMRDAISVLDRMLSAGEKKLTGEMVEQLLGMPRGQLVFDLVQKIGEGDVPETLARMEKMLATGLSPDSLLAALIEHLRNLMVIRACGGKSDLVQATTLSADELAKQAARFELVFLSQDIVVLEELRRQIRQTQAHRALLDATMVRLALTEQFTPIGELAENSVAAAALPAAQKKKLENEASAASPGAAVAALAAHRVEHETPAAGAAPAEALTEMASAPAEAAAADDGLDDADALPAVGKVWEEGEKVSLSTIMARGKAATAPSFATVDDGEAAGVTTPEASTASAEAAETIDTSDVRAVWKRLLETTRDLGVGVSVPLAKGQLVRLDDQQAVVRFASAFAHMAGVLRHKEETLRQRLQSILDRPVQLVMETEEAPAAAQGGETAGGGASGSGPRRAADAGTAAPATPAPIALTPELRQQLAGDPLVRGVMEQLGGTIIRVELNDA